jgi:argininosuccinate lyase
VPRRFGEIRFALPARAGRLRAPVRLPQDAPGRECLRHFHEIRRPGDPLALRGDFRDRVAAVICAGPSQEAVEAAARGLCAHIAIEVDERPADDAAPAPSVLPEALQAIVYGGGAAAAPAEREAELALLADVNEAHLVMLGETGLVERAHVDALLRAHHALRAAAFAPLRTLPRPRGTYVMFEQYLIAQLGPETGGVLQTGRSRNDINAALAKLKVRSASADLQRRLARLRAALILQASRHVGEAFPIYSQFQPAQPGTFAHQLLAIDAALAAETAVLLDALPELDVCPLGAAAGAGTTFAIDPELVARLLGFERAARNSLDAVASRSAALHFLSALNAIGVLVSRIAQDLQQWTTMESALVRLPDALCGGSSMMPQKRNPFLVELVKARGCVPVGCLATATAVMSKVPYANSYEAGSPIDGLLAQAAGAIADALTVLQALLEGLTVDASRVDVRLRESGVAAAAVAETLVRERRLSFRTAHGQVGQALRANGGEGSSARALQELAPFVAEQPPLEWALRHAHGGGPGSARLADGIADACNALAADESRLRVAEQLWQEGAALRRVAIERALAAAAAAIPQPEPESAR